MSYLNNRIAFSGNKPMCGIGTQIEPGESKDAIIARAGLDWTIDTMPVSYQHNGQTFADNTRKMLVRSDNSELLHVASNRFKEVTPKMILKPFFEVIEKLNFEIEVIGELDGGRKIFCRAKAPNNLEINGDKIQGYLTIATANDGSMQTVANIGGTRLACMNETPMLFKASNNRFKVRHSSSFDPDRMLQDLGLVKYNAAWDDFEETVQGLINRRVDSKQAIELIHKVAGTGKPIDEESTRTRNIIEQIYSNVVRSPGSQLETTHGTAWGVFNGISYYTDHQQGTNINNRAKGLLPGGTGHKMKMNALELLNMLPENISNEAYQTQNNALEILGMQ